MVMSRRTVRAALVSAVLAICAQDAPAQPPGQIEEMTRSAQLVFRGTVQRVGAANLSTVAPADDTVIVRIEDVLKAPASLEDFTGREVTVKLRQPGSVRAGDARVFFTNGWLYGESLGLVEVGQAAGDPAALRGQIAEAVRRGQEEKLRERLDRAALVVLGRVVETRPAPARGEGRVTEHDPQWWEAVIEVGSVLKGSAPGQRVSLFFPMSRDVTWYEAPKPAAGWDGIWLLYREQIPNLQAPGYTGLKPWNLMPRESLGTVQRLVGR